MAARTPKQAFSALSELARRPAGPNHFQEFHAQSRDEKNHRGAAILLAANTEVALDYALKRIICENRERILFRSQGVLDSFRNKIHVGYAFGLFGEQTFDALEGIREIRNAFAHAQIPISFDEPEVMEVCSLLPIQDFLPPRAVDANAKDQKDSKGLERYRAACERIGHNLSVLNWRGVFSVKPHLLAEKGIAPIPGDYNFLQVRQSLP